MFSCKLLRGALLAALPVLMQAQSQVCVAVPTPGTAITQDTLNELRKRGAIAPGVSAFASLESFAAAFGGSLPYVPQTAEGAKFWADFSPGNEYLMVDGSLDTSNVATWSDSSMEAYGKTIATFYQDRVAAKDDVFRRIPRLVKFTVRQPSEMNMLTGVGRPGPRTVTMVESPYPLARLLDDPVGPGGKRWSWPTNHILRYKPGTTEVEACDYQQYGLAFPIITSVSVGGSAGAIRLRSGMTPEVFLSNVGSALFGAGSPGKRAAKIITFLEVQ